MGGRGRAEGSRRQAPGSAGGLFRTPAIAGLVALVALSLAGFGISAVARGSPRGPHAGAAVVRPVTATASSRGGVRANDAASPSATVTASPVPPPSPAPVPQVDAAGTVWLCRPGLANNPCAGNLDATSVSATGARSLVPASPAAGEGFDCFYVYPTVSLQDAPNADLAVQPPETEVAMRQAAQFSRVCNVWAPMYRQRTLAALPAGSFDPVAAGITAYDSLLAAWKDYLANFNDGRPIIFIGHSQGTTMLINLLHYEVDGNPAVRSKLVSALLIGGYPTVAPGSDVGGSFQNIPACRSITETGCVIGYNSYYGVPGPDSQFGHPGATTLCTNPAALGGGSGALDPIFVPAGNSPAGPPVTTPYLEYPGLYTASCQSAAGATWLQVVPAPLTPGDPRARLTDRIGVVWGLHADDVSLALGNLLEDVAAEEAAYRP